MNQGRSACRRTGQGRERPRRATARGWTARQGAESGPQSSEGTTSATFSTLFPGLLSLLAIVQAHSSPEGSQRAGGSCPQGKCNSEGAGGAACERAPWCGVAVTSVNVYLGCSPPVGVAQAAFLRGGGEGRLGNCCTFPGSRAGCQAGRQAGVCLLVSAPSIFPSTLTPSACRRMGNQGSDPRAGHTLPP